MTVFVSVGRGPVPRHRSGTRHSTIAGDRPPRYGEKNASLHVGRGPVPRRAAVYRTIAGDRPPRYGENDGFRYRRAWALGCHTRIRAGFPRRAAVYRKIAGDRPPRYGENDGFRYQYIKPPSVHYSIAFMHKSNEKYPNARTIDKRQHSKNEPFHNSVV